MLFESFTSLYAQIPKTPVCIPNVDFSTLAFCDFAMNVSPHNIRVITVFFMIIILDLSKLEISILKPAKA